MSDNWNKTVKLAISKPADLNGLEYGEYFTSIIRHRFSWDQMLRYDTIA